MIIGEAYAVQEEDRALRAMAAECAAICQEFTGWEVTWTPTCGYRARKGTDKIGPTTSRSALRCQLALTEHRLAR